MTKIVDNIKILWETDRYDGPLAGMCEFEGDKCYFKFLHESNKNILENDVYSRCRIFGIYKLTPEELERETYWHNEFRKYVGTHCDYGEQGKVLPVSEHHKFYDRKEEREKDRPVLTQNKIVGIWVEHYIED